MTALSHGRDVLVMANREAGEAGALRKADFSETISVITPLDMALDKKFFRDGQDMVMFRVRKGTIVRAVQNGVPPESFFQ